MKRIILFLKSNDNAGTSEYMISCAVKNIIFAFRFFRKVKTDINRLFSIGSIRKLFCAKTMIDSIPPKTDAKICRRFDIPKSLTAGARERNNAEKFIINKFSA